MSQPSFPSISPPISREDAISMILSSIAMEELGISHILNAEGEKLQYVLGTLPGITGPGATVEEVLAANDSVRAMLDSTMQNQMFLTSKMNRALNAAILQGPTGPTGPTGPQALLAYGGLYDDAVQTITVAPGATEVVAMGETMPSVNVTTGTNNLTINEPGDYRVEFMVALQSTTGTFGLDVGVQINGNFSEPSLFTSSVLTSDFEFITVSSIVTLASGNVLNLAISSAAGGTVLFGPSLNASLSVTRLGN